MALRITCATFRPSGFPIFFRIFNCAGSRYMFVRFIILTSIHLTYTRVKTLYSSSRLVTLCLSPISFPTGDEFQWGEVGERLVGAHAVVGVFPMA